MASADLITTAVGPAVLPKIAPTIARGLEARVASGKHAPLNIIACENTMKNQKLVKDDMLRGIAYAPAGVVQIMERQKQGWSYIRP